MIEVIVEADLIIWLPPVYTSYKLHVHQELIKPNPDLRTLKVLSISRPGTINGEEAVMVTAMFKMTVSEDESLKRPDDYVGEVYPRLGYLLPSHCSVKTTRISSLRRIPNPPLEQTLKPIKIVFKTLTKPHK